MIIRPLNGLLSSGNSPQLSTQDSNSGQIRGSGPGFLNNSLTACMQMNELLKPKEFLLICSLYGNFLYLLMRIIAVKALKDFWIKHKDAEHPLRAWFTEAKRADLKKPADIIRQYRTAGVLKNNRVVFNIKGNDYRLITAINYDFKIIYIRFIGTHKEYDKINAEEI